MSENNNNENKNTENTEELLPGFLPFEEFCEKYETKYPQQHPESYLDELTEEEKEGYLPAEILTGRCHFPPGTVGNGRWNKFRKGAQFLKYSGKVSVQRKLRASFEKYLDQKIHDGDENEFWEVIWNSKQKPIVMKMLLDRMLGSVENSLKISGGEGEISFELKPSKTSEDRVKKNIENKK